MNVAWKFIAVLALLFSLTALTIEIVRIQSESISSAAQREAAVILKAREQLLVDRLRPRLKAMRQNRELPVKAALTLEEVCESMIEIIDTPHPSAPTAGIQPVARP